MPELGIINLEPDWIDKIDGAQLLVHEFGHVSQGQDWGYMGFQRNLFLN